MKWVLLFLPIFSFATTISIENDTDYPLVAIIESAEKKIVGEAHIAPRSGYTWLDSPQGIANWEKAPFRVTFKCKNGDTYGVIYPVNDKLRIYAKNATGRKRCGSP